MLVPRSASPHELIAGRKHGYLYAPFDTHMRCAGSGEDRDMPRVDECAGLYDL
jgi:hypothetical protein